MAKTNGRGEKSPGKRSPTITHVTVSGYKSIGREQTIEIRPLTLLAGVNSSGKSSMLQPLLLLKQTLEAPYDPGALLLSGPNVKFTSADQLFFSAGRTNRAMAFVISMRLAMGETVTLRYGRNSRRKIDLERMRYSDELHSFELWPEMTNAEIKAVLSEGERQAIEGLIRQDESSGRLAVKRRGCFFEIVLSPRGDKIGLTGFRLAPWPFFPALLNIIHVPGLRGNPERSYPVTPVGPTFPGRFADYAASIIAQWGTEGSDKLKQLGSDLEDLGLTWKVVASPVNDTQVEIKVGRLLRPGRGGAHDLVNIADVGFGVSQTLPVVVALLAAQPGQLVYLEQPEIHLHPRAQVALARPLLNAANRGVHVVAETHSTLLLLGVQTLVAEGDLAPDKVQLHWFRRRDTDGVTQVASAGLDEAGAFGDWPTDFDDVELKAQSRYLDAAGARRLSESKRP